MILQNLNFYTNTAFFLSVFFQEKQKLRLKVRLSLVCWREVRRADSLSGADLEFIWLITPLLTAICIN